MTPEYIHWSPDPVWFSLFGLDIRYYSVLWLIGLVSAFYVAKYIFKREKISLDLLDSLFFYVFIGTLLGARLGHCLFYGWSYFSHHPLEILLPLQFTGNGVRFTGYTGLASHGGAIGILVSLILFHIKHKLPLLTLFDTLGIIAPLTGAFIRIGNFVNSEIIGAPASVPWAIVFDSVDSLPRHPAQLYEAAAYFIIFAILIVIYRKKLFQLNSGRYFGLSIFLIFLFRLCIEFCKEVQEVFEVNMISRIGLDMGQILSIPFIVAGLFFLIYPSVRKSS